MKKRQTTSKIRKARGRREFCGMNSEKYVPFDIDAVQYPSMPNKSCKERYLDNIKIPSLKIESTRDAVSFFLVHVQAYKNKNPPR